MNLTKTRMKSVQEYRDSFLDMHYKELFHDDGYSKEGNFWVYFIVHKPDKKVYVGKCRNIHDRASTYIRVWMNNDPKYTQRPIAAAMCKEGLDKFIMYPVVRTKTDWDACCWEKYCIDKLNSTNPDVGYNIKSNNDFRQYKKHVENHHSIATKIVKGKPMICIHPEMKIAYVTVGMKIFGDFLGISKDLVKNCAKRPCMCRGFHIYYLNEIDREELYEKRKNTRDYNDERKDNKEKYLSLYPYVKQFSEKPDPTIFTDIGYDMWFITYNADTASQYSYEILPIESFMEFVNDSNDDAKE